MTEYHLPLAYKGLTKDEIIQKLLEVIKEKAEEIENLEYELKDAYSWEE